MMENKQIEMVNPLDPDKGPIKNTEMERVALASLMTFNNTLDETNDLLTPECFSDSTNREIFEAIVSVYKQGNFPDMMLVSDELAKRGSNISPLQVTELYLGTEKVMDLHPHSLILKDYAMRRKLWETGYKLLCNSADLSYPLPTVQQEAKANIESVFDNEQSKLKTLQTSYLDLQQRMLYLMNMPEGEIIGTPTGFTEIDRDGGLCGGDLLIIGAETSQGKTSFATALSLSAIEHGDGVAFYSLEMSALQLTARIASMKSGISAKKMMRQRMTIEEIYRIDHCMEKVDCSKMYFDERSTSSLDSILMSIRSMKMKHGIKGAVVDFLQLVKTKDKESSMNIEQQTAKCARDLKNLAKELDIWIIGISQLSRNPQNPVPSMARLRNSGQIEEAADEIILIYRPREGRHSYPEPFKDVSTEGTAMVMIAKGRNVGTGEFICGFKPENTLFYSLNEDELLNTKRLTPLSEITDDLLEEKPPF